MSEFIMNTNTNTTTVAVTRDGDTKVRIAAAASNTTTVTKDATSSTATMDQTATSTEQDSAAEAALAEEAAAGEAGEVAPAEASTEIAEEGTDAVMVETEATAVSEPVPVFEGGPVGDIGFDEGMYMDPTMETGMAEVKDPLLSSWPFVIGISAVVLLVSMALGALLARRKIKKGIELYED